MKIDVNCDMGEGTTPENFILEGSVMEHITSVNIACGFHAGGPSTMAETVRLAAAKGLAIGAHPGYADLSGFGRREMSLESEEITHILLYQMGALNAFCKAAGIKMRHVKPHGALYNRAVVDEACAMAIVNAVLSFDPALILVGLAGSVLVDIGRESGLQTASEGFPDRGYSLDGKLLSRSQAGSVISDSSIVAQNAVKMAKKGVSIEMSGVSTRMRVDTLCLHGDNPAVLGNAKSVKYALNEAGINLAPLGV